MGKKKQKLVLPPELPPDVPDEEIEVSDEDLKFVDKNEKFAEFVSNLDTNSITKHVTRVADAKEDVLESLYEKRLNRKLENTEKDRSSAEVHPVDALPVKTLKGELYYQRVTNVPTDAEGESTSKDPSSVRLTKAEKHLKNKKLRKEAKKQAKEEVQPTPRAELDEVKKDLTAEEAMKIRNISLLSWELHYLLIQNPISSI